MHGFANFESGYTGCYCHLLSIPASAFCRTAACLSVSVLLQKRRLASLLHHFFVTKACTFLSQPVYSLQAGQGGGCVGWGGGGGRSHTQNTHTQAHPTATPSINPPLLLVVNQRQQEGANLGIHSALQAGSAGHSGSRVCFRSAKGRSMDSGRYYESLLNPLTSTQVPAVHVMGQEKLYVLGADCTDNGLREVRAVHAVP